MYARLSLLLIVMLCLTGAARAQSGGGSVRMSGVVSETVALSITQGAWEPGVSVTTTRNADRSLTVTLSGTTRELTQLSLYVQVRSNADYRLYAKAEAGDSNLSSLLVTGARPTGDLVVPGAAEAVSVAAAFDAVHGAERFKRPDLSAPTELLSGPRASLGGTLQSPHNAVEVVLSMTVEPRADGQGWTVGLLLSAEPDGHLP
ncbi:MAG: hypothetical protein ACJ754_01375 [Pyrinomonadaceae bacterium]